MCRRYRCGGYGGWQRDRRPGAERFEDWRHHPRRRGRVDRPCARRCGARRQPIGRAAANQQRAASLTDRKGWRANQTPGHPKREDGKFKRLFLAPCRLVKAVGRACYGLWSRLRRLSAFPGARVVSIHLFIGVHRGVGIDARMARRSSRLGVPLSSRVRPATGRVAKATQHLARVLQGLSGFACVDRVTRSAGAASTRLLASIRRLFVQASKLFVQI